MVLFGVILCLVSFFIIYQRLSFVLFGQSSTGTIIGYGNMVKGYKGFDAYPYKVKYEYKNKEYIAYSLESTIIPCGNIPRENLKRIVTICFKKNRPEVVTIKELNGTLKIAILLLVLGIALLLFG